MRSPVYAILFGLLLLLVGSARARAEAPASPTTGWVANGATWTYHGAISLDVPAAFKSTLKDQILTLTAQSGAVSLTFVGAHGQSELDQLIRTVNETLSENKATMKPRSHTIVQKGVEMAFREGEAVLKSLPYDLTIVVMGSDDDNFVLCQLLMPKQATEAATPLLDGLFSSVRESKDKAR